MKQFLVCTIILVVVNVLHAQVDFNNYQSLRSQGAVPADFSTATQQKIQQADKERLDDLSPKKRELFVEQVNYTIDGLLKSGLVTFGDPVSLYLQRIGDRLVANDESLKGKLRFYTFNTNEANAFSTDQGMVFVTTGLIAQLTNEAQLAFVLAHEIIHYKEKHVLDLFDYTTTSSGLTYNEKVRFFSKYSRDNEFEADLNGVKLYNEAGYNSEEIVKTFDVLIYSYLPFEELAFDKSYFNNEFMFVPENVFKHEVNEISAKSNYNDRLTSHPNIVKRTEELQTEVAKFSNWGTTLNFEEQTFQEVRDICRFEYIQNHIYSGESIDALYGIYIMENKYPNSRFLRNCKSQIWLDYIYKEKVDEFSFDFDFYNDYEDKGIYDYEGQISVLARTLLKLPSQAKLAMGLRIIKDNFKKDTTDRFANQLWDKAIEFAAFNDEFEFDQFSKNTFQQAIDQLAKEKKENDSIKAIKGTTNQNWDKYQTIKNQKSGFTIDAGIDSTKFYLYGISDLISDSTFKKRLDYFTNRYKEKEQESDELFEMTDDEIDAFYQDEYDEKLHLDMDTVLMVNPLVYEIERYQTLNYKKSDKLEDDVIASVNKVAAEMRINVIQLDRSNQQKMTADDYNNLAQLMRSLERRVTFNGAKSFILDLEQLDSLRKIYGTNKLMLLEYSHEYDSGITLGSGLLGTLIFPIGMVYFPIAILSGHHTHWNVYVLNLETGELIIDQNYESDDLANKKFIELRLNALFHQLKQEKND